MTALPRRDFRLRIVGPLACLALLLYGAVSLTKPHYSYFLAFSFSGETQGSPEAGLRLDDGMLRVGASRADETLRFVALPIRTIRSIQLTVGQNGGAGVIANPRIVRFTDTFRAAFDGPARVFRLLDFDAATEGLSVRERARDRIAFEVLPGAARASVTLDLSEPLYLLRDMQIAWIQRSTAVLLAAALVLWLALSQRHRLPVPNGTRLRDLLNGPRATAALCGLWAILTFSLTFGYAGRIPTFTWNSVEFIIANHLRDFGHYALGATYPAAIWRPIGPTFLVLAVDTIVRDPLLTYQLLAAAAMTSLIVSTYVLNRTLFGPLLANAGAALAFAVPAVGISLINHAHSISHLCFLLVASPTLLASVTGLLAIRGGRPNAPRWLWAASIGWSLCYLCRPESMFMAAFFFGAVAVQIVRHKRSLGLLAPLTSFVVVFAGFNVWASAAATRDDLLSRKVIYQYYASQGWTELAEIRRRSADDDIERVGYVRAIEVYGTPDENSESLIRAIARNPQALVDRIESNVLQLIELLFKGGFLSFDVLLLLLALPVAFFWLEGRFRLAAIFAVSVFSAVGVFLILHIDDRYVTIVLPAVLLLASFSAHGLNRLPMPDRFGRNAFAGIVLAIALLHLPLHVAALSNAFGQRLNLSPVRAIAQGFRTIVRADENAIVQLDLPLPPALKSAATLLFPYFARTSLFWGAPSDSYPRDRLFSLPQCPATYAIAPATQARGDNGARLGTFSVPRLGELAVFRLSPAAPAAGTFAAKFCAVP